jgi:hypothetical protein
MECFDMLHLSHRATSRLYNRPESATAFRKLTEVIATSDKKTFEF